MAVEKQTGAYKGPGLGFHFGRKGVREAEDIPAFDNALVYAWQLPFVFCFCLERWQCTSSEINTTHLMKYVHKQWGH